MTPREQLLKMLLDAKIDFHQKGGDEVIIDGRASFRFDIKGDLKEVASGAY